MLKKINSIKLYAIILFLIFTSKSIINLNEQQYFYGDDSWLLLGSRFDSLLDSLRCCAVSHPVFTIFAQSVFKILDFSTQNTVVFFLVYSNLLALLVWILPEKILNNTEKLIALILIISSPMFIQYGIRTKPYTTDVAISIITIFLFYKIQLEPKKIYFFSCHYGIII